MNSVVEFLHELRTKSVRISAAGNELVCEAPPGVLTPALRERLTENKPVILRLLTTALGPEHVAAIWDNSAPPAPRLSRAQSSIWLLEQIAPGTSVWNLSWALDARGQLDRGALQASFRGLLVRHAALRSRFRNIGGEPVVEYAPLGDWSIDYVDLRGLPDAENQAAALVNEEVRRPFDLERGPVCRVRLLQTADAAYVLVVVVHHMVADGWSFGLMGLELSQMYQALLQGREASFPPLRADYQAFVRHERSGEAATQADLDWWREKLSGELPIISLASDSTRRQSGAGRRVSIELGPDLTSHIDTIAKENQASPFMVLLAAFKLLIHRYTGLTDLLIGVHVSGRNRPEFADVIGMFVNTLVLRTAITPDLTVSELLSRVRETSLEALARQHVAFDRIVEAVNPRRIAGHNPLVRHAFAYQNLPPAELRLGSTELTHRPLDFVGSRYELSVEIWRTPRGLLCDFEYATDLFEAEKIDRLTDHYRRLLMAIVAEPQEQIFKLPLLSGPEREQLLIHWNDTSTNYPMDRRLEDLFAEQAAKTPDAPALIHCGREMSYRELDRRANQLARHLRTLGVGPDILVGVCLERSPELVVAILAVLKAGGAYVPLDPQYPALRLTYMLADSAALVLITHSALRHVVPDHDRVLELDLVQEMVAGQPPTAPVSGATAENLAYVIYTSGSTGRPKGTMLRHSASYLVDWARRTFAPEDLARVVAATSICFDLSVFEFFIPLCTGGAIILVADPLDPPDPASRPTLLNTVPSALAELARTRAIPNSVRTIIACGERLNNTTVQALYEASKVERVYNLYGPTEYTTYGTAALTFRGATRDPPIGRPLCNTQVYVLDAQYQLLPVGVVGELYIAGHGLARGYLGQPELTAQRFVGNPFGAPGSLMYRTGDLVRWNSDGQLEFMGRVDHQIKLRGYRIELSEIEATLRCHSAVRDAVILSRQDQPGNTYLVAYIVANGKPPSAATLHQHAKEWLPEYMVPSVFEVLPAFPLTPSGKIDRSALPRPVLHQPEPMAERVWMPPLQEIVGETFGQILQLDHFGPNDNFFEKGGHSLQVLEVASHLERLLTQSISPAWIFQAPTPHELGSLLDSMLVKAASHLAPLQLLGNRPPLFCLHNLFSRALDYISLARRLAPDQPVYGLVPGPLEDAFIADPTLEVLTPAYIRAIKEIQPRGPYRVVGYSFGGVPAFDMAQNLLAEGEDVLLIMIDPYIYRGMPTIAQTAKWVSRRGRRALNDIWTAGQPTVPGVIQMGKWAHGQAQRVLRHVHERFTRWGLPQEAGAASRVPDWVPAAARPLAKSLLQAGTAYKFRPYNGAVVFLQGTHRDKLLDFLNADGLNGWDGLFRGHLARVELPAQHFWMMRDPFVSEVATILRTL